MKGIIVINGYSKTEGIAYQVKRLTEEFVNIGVKIEVRRTNELLCFIENNCIVSKLKCDFIVYLDKDIHIAMMLEKLGFRLFNSREAIEICDDKIKTHIALAGYNIPQPKTISSPLMYNNYEDDFQQKVEEVLSYPMVVKEAHGSLGGQVYLVKNGSELKSVREKLKLKPHLYQQFIDKSYGKDTRVIVVGGEVVASYNRISKGDFRSNLELGGFGKTATITSEYVKLCKQVSSILHLDYCGIDILDNGGLPVLCEVNSNAFFTGAEKITGVNIAKIYANYIVNKVNQG